MNNDKLDELTAKAHEVFKDSCNHTKDAIYYMQALIQVELERSTAAKPPFTGKCEGNGIGNKSCSNPKLKTIKSGATYMDAKCETCGGSVRDTWD